MKQLLFITAMSLLAIKASAQNVGIGTNTPQSKLHIISAGNEVARLDAGNPFLSLYSNGVYKGYFWISPNSIEIGSASGSGLPVTLAPDGYQRMFVTAAGNVGIGTATPAATLDIMRGTATGGTAQFSGTQYASHFNYSTNEDTYIRAGKDNGNLILNDIPGGNVGIGTATPLQKLQVEGTTFLNGNVGIGTSNPFALLGFGNASGEIISFNGTASNNYGIGVQLGLLQIHTNVAGADIAFGYGSSAAFTERMRIKGNGRVGIGTTNPSEILHVEGTTFLNGNVGIGGLGPSANKLSVEGTVFLNGNVGIGTFPGVSEKLIVAGSTFLDGPTYITGPFGISDGGPTKPGGGPWFASSDARLKENILPYTDGLSLLLKITPVKYHYNQLSGYDSKPEYIGVLAQDLKSIAPYMVGSFQKEGEFYYNVNNSAMTYMLINAVKEQQLMIDKQQQQIDELKKLIEISFSNKK